MHLGRICSTFALALLAACGSGDQSQPLSGAAPRLLSGGPAAGPPMALAEAPAFITFPAFRSQYTIAAATDGYLVSDIATGAAQIVPVNSRLRFADTAVALDFNGNAGLAYRLYLATLSREPDLYGLGFHINTLDVGHPSTLVSGNFVNSAEFIERYGLNLSQADFVTLLYANVLHRAPDPSGLAWHVEHLEGTNIDGIRLTRTETVLNFSESIEFKSNVQPSIASGIEYVPWGSGLPANPVADYAMQYQGTMSGAETGPFSITVGTDGAMAAAGTTSLHSISGNGMLAAGGRFNFVAGTSLGQQITFKGAINLGNGVAAGTWLNTSSGASGVFSLFKPVVAPPPVSYAQVGPVISQRCMPCHSAQPTQPGFGSAPLGIRFDSEAEVRARAGDVQRVAVIQMSMPYSNLTGMTQAERDLLAAWFAGGTP